jgi:predicted benzoate:H+ symporter BenE
MGTLNVGVADRVVRGFVGILLLGLYGALPSPWKYLTLAGLVLLATAATGFCPLYRLVGLSTCRR